MMRPFRLALLVAALALILTSSALALTYDASLGTLPTAQGWQIVQASGPLTSSVSGGFLLQNTTGSNAFQQYWQRSNLLVDYAQGFTMEWGLGLRVRPTSAMPRFSAPVGWWKWPMPAVASLP